MSLQTFLLIYRKLIYQNRFGTLSTTVEHTDIYRRQDINLPLGICVVGLK